MDYGYVDKLLVSSIRNPFLKFINKLQDSLQQVNGIPLLRQERDLSFPVSTGRVVSRGDLARVIENALPYFHIAITNQ
jgi:hypothetical protein